MTNLDNEEFFHPNSSASLKAFKEVFDAAVKEHGIKYKTNRERRLSELESYVRNFRYDATPEVKEFCTNVLAWIILIRGND